MAKSSHIEPGSWRIVLEATEARLTTSGRRGRSVLFEPLRLDGAFYLRPDAALAGFDLRLPLASPRAKPPVPPLTSHRAEPPVPPLTSHHAEPPVLHWEAVDLDRGAHAWLRCGGRAVRSPVSVVCAEIPGEHPYVKIVLETVFASNSLRLPGRSWLRPRPVTLRLFSEIRSTAG